MPHSYMHLRVGGRHGWCWPPGRDPHSPPTLALCAQPPPFLAREQIGAGGVGESPWAACGACAVTRAPPIVHAAASTAAAWVACGARVGGCVCQGGSAPPTTVRRDFLSSSTAQPTPAPPRPHLLKLSATRDRQLRASSMHPDFHSSNTAQPTPAPPPPTPAEALCRARQAVQRQLHAP